MNQFLKSISNQLEKDNSDYIYNILKIENFSSSNSRLRFWYNHCKNNFDSIEGDIFEFGVFQGTSIISMAILLKKLGSKKTIYGFDSFEGFPRFHKNDSISMFETKSNHFSVEHRNHVKNLSLLEKQFSNIKKSDTAFSSNFSDSKFDILKKKIDLLGLDNIILVKGDFKDTIPPFFKNFDNSIFSINIDCDLYEGYKLVFENTWNLLNHKSYIHLDEYYSLRYPGARIATDDFLKNKLQKPFKQQTPIGEFERWGILK
ncbi:MAG: hypothetical protein HOH98_06805 [Flavobacteriaceae bacterium]|jgi:hypothetical protein|nr:hypothetical protein [Flavobacteriaceae bacterium]